MGRVFLTDESRDNDYSGIIRLENEIVASIKDRFILRSDSPIKTIGG